MITVGQDEAAQAMAERDPLPQEVTYHVWTDDEPAAGLQGERAEVRMAVDAEDDAEARKMLNRTFSVFWGEQTRHVRVMREEPPERTPETVLRAMVNAYDTRAERATVDYYRRLGPFVADDSESERAQRAASDACQLLYCVLAGRDPSGLVSASVIADYQARLSGARDLNAPPLEEP